MKKHQSIMLMKIIGLVVLLHTLNLNAQIAMSLSVNHKNYLQYEPVFVKLVMHNYTGRPIIFGEKKSGMYGKLIFEIKTPDGRFAIPKGDFQKYILGIIIAPAASEKVIIPISSYYNLSRLGRYSIKAVIRHSQLTSMYESNVMTFTVAKGVLVWERIVGVPNLTGKPTTEKIPVRYCKIVTFFDGNDQIYYFIIEDKCKIYTIVRIGYDIRTSPPKCMIDGLSRIHILLRQSPKIFSYFVYTIDGKLDKKAVYYKSDTIPSLVKDPKTAMVTVAGGRKAIPSLEYKQIKNSIFE